MISFPAFLSSCCLSLLAAGQKWAGRKEGMAQKLLSSPSPCSSGVAGTLLSLSLVLQTKERDVEMHSCLISNPPFFSPPWPNSLRVNTSLTCTKNSPPGISHFWFCFCLGLYIPLCTKVALYCFFLSFTVTFHTVHVSALLAPNTMPKPPPFLFDWETLGLCVK